MPAQFLASKITKRQFHLQAPQSEARHRWSTSMEVVVAFVERESFVRPSLNKQPRDCIQRLSFASTVYLRTRLIPRSAIESSIEDLPVRWPSLAFLQPHVRSSEVVEREPKRQGGIVICPFLGKDFRQLETVTSRHPQTQVAPLNVDRTNTVLNWITDYRLVMLSL